MYVSSQILAMPIEAVAALSEHCAIRYLPTGDEIQALRWIGDRYSISAYLLDSVVETGMLTIEPFEVSRALAEDGVDCVPCLDENTALARLIWAIGF